MPFALKADIPDPTVERFALADCKTMYGGKHVALGDVVFLFASETSGGRGLIARGIVDGVEAVAGQAKPARQTPRVSVTIRRTALSLRPLGRGELKPWRVWTDGRPETELNFKLYRQATDKLAGLSDVAADFLATYF